MFALSKMQIAVLSSLHRLQWSLDFVYLKAEFDLRVVRDTFGGESWVSFVGGNLDSRVEALRV